MPVSDEWPERDTWIDKRGTLCPAPVIALARAAKASVQGKVIVVLSDDPAAEFDIPAWCRMTRNFYLSAELQDVGTAYAVRISEG